MFTRLGFTAFGGPAAHLALMEDEVVRRRRWIDRGYFMDLIAAINFIPGPNSTELAIHLGLIRAGYPGLVVAGACFILPAVLIILPVAWLYVRFGQVPQVQGALLTINAAVVAVVAAALGRFARAGVRDSFTAALAVLAATVGFLADPKAAARLSQWAQRHGGLAALGPLAWLSGHLAGRASELWILAAAALLGALRYGWKEIVFWLWWVGYGLSGKKAGLFRGVLPPLAFLGGRAASSPGSVIASGMAPGIAAGAVGAGFAATGPTATAVAAAGAAATAVTTAAAGAGAGAVAAGGFAPLFWFFVKVGATLFGSGYVLVSYLQGGLVDRLGWIDSRQLTDAVAVGQVTPGPLLTTATFIGFLLGFDRFGRGLAGGVGGALLATAGIFLPSFVFVALLGPILPALRRRPLARGALTGVNAAVVALILVVTARLAAATLTGPVTVAVGLAALVALSAWNVNSTWLILGAAAVGWATHAVGWV